MRAKVATYGDYLESLLKRRHEAKLVWHEPYPGKSADGKSVPCDIEKRMTVHDAINMYRFNMPGSSDLEILGEFFVIEHCEVVQ